MYGKPHIKREGLGNKPLDVACLIVQCTSRCRQEYRVELPVRKPGEQPNQSRLVEWSDGTFIQDAFPDLNADNRELMISGTCPKCWEQMFDPKTPKPASKKKFWTGVPPEICELCDELITTDFVDGVLAGQGTWGIMCLKCLREHGSGLGLGVGQRYHRNNDGVFEKVEG